jgi:NADPH:quinone reductase-like Zn-dependent oxidoreductase
MAPVEQIASVVTANGGVELGKVPVPKPGRNHVLIKVVAAAFNPIDCTIDYVSFMIVCLTYP